ncbi:MAG TPA: cytochrome ubiquinol oxidase subunit I [Pseudonocardiaceae bacterium]
MNALDLARWQFGITTVYHFLFVPMTIGLAVLTAILQSAWVKTGKEHYLRATKFWGKLFLINFALGVATGIVQEFQFGMNWSEYSRFVGDIFGAPLAMEALIAFFLESTFLGLWIFGWNRLSKGVHLTTIWLASIGTVLSAFFILAANSWMQHPVGYVAGTYADGTKKAVLNDFLAVAFNSTVLGTFPHTIFAAFLTASLFIIGISAWQLHRGHETKVFRTSARFGLVVLLIASIGTLISGDQQARIMTSQQPMKMAAAEALYQTSSPASFSLFTVGSLDGLHEVWSIRVPGVLSFMATGSFSGTVEGINNVASSEAQQFGGAPADYIPNVPLTYWTFRIMVGLGFLALIWSIVGLYMFRRGRTPAGKWFTGLALAGIALPYLANSLGWIFTEMGRQPWIVYGLLKTQDAVSGFAGWNVLITVVVFTLLYAALAVVAVRLAIRYIKLGAEPAPAPEGEKPEAPEETRPPVFAY